MLTHQLVRYQLPAKLVLKAAKLVFHFMLTLWLFAAFTHPALQEWYRQVNVGVVHQHLIYLVVQALIGDSVELACQLCLYFFPEICFILYLYVLEYLCIQLRAHFLWYQQAHLGNGEFVVLAGSFLACFQRIFQKALEFFGRAYFSRHNDECVFRFLAHDHCLQLCGHFIQHLGIFYFLVCFGNITGCIARLICRIDDVFFVGNGILRFYLAIAAFDALQLIVHHLVRNIDLVTGKVRFILYCIYFKFRLDPHFERKVYFSRIVHIQAGTIVARQYHRLREDGDLLRLHIVFQLLACIADHLFVEDSGAMHFAHHARWYHPFTETGYIRGLSVLLQRFFKGGHVVVLHQLYGYLIMQRTNIFTRYCCHICIYKVV